VTAPIPFRFVAGIALEEPTQTRAESAAALREVIAGAPAEALHHHVIRIGARFPRSREVPPNDFARWTGEQLQDPGTAERLAYAGFGVFGSLEELRGRLLAALGASPSKREVRDDEARFRLVAARMVPVPLDVEASSVEELLDLWPTLGHESSWYHVVDAPLLGHAEGQGLIAWLERAGGQRWADSAREALRSPRAAVNLHAELLRRWRRSDIARRVVERADRPRRVDDAGDQAALSRIAQRLHGAEPRKET
jgi:hypothetical protein